MDDDLHIRPFRTILVDDHPTYRAGLRMLLAPEPSVDIVGEANNADEALKLAAQVSPELAFVDLHLPGTDGIALTALLQPACRVIGLSMSDEPIRIAQMLRAGAAGYVLKSQPVEATVEAITCLRSGKRYLPPTVPRARIEELLEAEPPFAKLSPREREVFDRLIELQSNDTIARALFISNRTVETHRQRIMGKLGVHTIVELVDLAARHGMRKR
jgi:two-component system nitrate/nitrite response regulator NarL